MYQNSKLDVRLEAARLAVSLKDVTVRNVVVAARAIEKYITGDTELPEVYDPDTYMDTFRKVLEITSGKQQDDSGKQYPVVATSLKDEKEKVN